MSTSDLLDIVRAQGRGEARGIWSVCSAHPAVIEAAMEQAQADGSTLLVESTAQQVNQEGGYTGMTPAAFASLVLRTAERKGLPVQRLVLGGDHLGPLPFRRDRAGVAMAKACELVRQCALAGYTKLHLDASMRLAGDVGSADAPLAPETATERAAALCAAAEDAHCSLPPGAPAPLYVVGTDVPAPGGDTGVGTPEVTAADAAERTWALSRTALRARGLEAACERVIALVVQPGVDFGEFVVHAYDRAKAAPLCAWLRRNPGLVYEAHSTDYQAPEALSTLVEDGFAIVKVGPALTSAFREAVFALEAIEREWLSARGVALSGVREVLDEVMRADPRHWRDHHRGEEAALRVARAFALSDRARYYWPHPRLQEALARLEANLRARPAPLPLVSQYLPAQAAAIRSGEIPASPAEVVRHKIREVTAVYARACRSARTREKRP